MTGKGEPYDRLLRAFFFLATMFYLAVGAWAGNVLKVGPDQPYATIQSAVDAVQTGDAILVYPSTYEESVSVTKNGISIVAQGDGVIVGPPPVQKKACFEVKADRVAIQGFELTGTTMAPGIRFEGSYNRFSGNRIYGLSGLGVNALNCRDPNGGSNFNVIENNYITGADLGIVVGADTETAVNKGNIITGNTIRGMGTVGIAIYNCTESTITGNVIEGVPFGLGISIAALTGKVPQHSHTVTGNKITGSAEGGIGVFADVTTILSRVTISYNDIDSPGDYGILLQKDSGAHLAHNVILGNWVKNADAAGVLVETGVNENTVDRNLVFNSGLCGIEVDGNRNKINSNTALENSAYDLCDSGKANRWKDNVYGTASWKGGP
jgi:parallel beta-helix repeat protein